MHILITGGTGFIGRVLCKTLREEGHQLTVLSRQPDTVSKRCGSNVIAIKKLDVLQSNDHFDAVINLAGEGIADARWSPSRKQILLDSRVKVTEQLVAYMARAQIKPEVLISGSAVGYYGSQEDAELNEDSVFKQDFSHSLCAQWEAAAENATQYGVRVCIIRTGLVIGQGGGFLKRLLRPFKLGLGGRLGDGTQWMSWIHMNDYIRILLMLLESDKLDGVFNATAPNSVSNNQFTRSLAKCLNRPALMPIPAFVLKLLLGEMAELLLGGQKVLPKRLLQKKFEFEFTTLEPALRDVL